MTITTTRTNTPHLIIGMSAAVGTTRPTSTALGNSSRLFRLATTKGTGPAAPIARTGGGTTIDQRSRTETPTWVTTAATLPRMNTTIISGKDSNAATTMATMGVTSLAGKMTMAASTTKG